MRDIPCFQGACEEEGAQNLKRIKQILSELYFPQLRQLRQATWGLTSAWRQLTSGLTWQLSIWRRDRASLFFSWKTAWWSQEKTLGQDPGQHIEGINQYQIVDMWRQRSLHRWWWHCLVWFVSKRFVNKIIKWLDYQSNISKTLIIKGLDNQDQITLGLGLCLLWSDKARAK